MDRLMGQNIETRSDADAEFPNMEKPELELELLFRERVCNPENGVFYFPVRHHSPACSFHLLRVVQSYKPDVILIEGPESGSHLIPVLADQATETPVSLYCAYENDYGKKASYYPLLAYSPEYIAIKEAARLGIPALFIDLDRYHGAEPDGEATDESSAQSAQDERLLTQSEFIERLCRKTNSRSFDELWEKLFEIGGAAASTEDFLRGIFAYCTLSRMCYSRDELSASGDLAREARMKTHIREAMLTNQRVLVLTGGFHTYGLILDDANGSPLGEHSEALSVGAEGEAASQHPSDRQSRPATKSLQARSEPGRSEIYPMVYTMQEADRLNGYASGMPHVRYYGLIWEKLQDGKPKPYARTAIAVLSELAHKLRKQQESVSTSDAIEAYSLLQSLAELRGKREGGVYELRDSILSSFVKGELTLATGKPLDELGALLTGDAIGSVAPNPYNVPIVEDFKQRCQEAGLQIKTTGRRKKILEPYAKPKHLELVRLLRCAAYLVPEFATRESGPDWVAGRNLNLVRESWSYGYSSLIESRLIQCSLYGGTLREAAARRLEEGLSALPEHSSGEYARAMLEALLMGLQDTAGRLHDRVRGAMQQDGHFLSLCQTVSILSRVQQHGRLLGLEDNRRLPELVGEAYRNAVGKLPHIRRAHEDEHDGIIQGIKLLTMLAASKQDNFEDGMLRETLNELLADHGLPPKLEGVCMAVSLSLGEKTRHELVARARAYIRGTPEQARQIPRYLSGVFSAARDAFLYDNELLNELHALIGEMPRDEFIAMAPELRLAFTFFTPMETALIAERVADLQQVEPEALLQPAMDEEELARAKILDEAIRREFESWKLA